MAFTKRQRVFIEEYLQTWNATDAARKAGYSPRTAYSIGQENLKKPEIAAEIERRIDEKSMCANEVLVRLADHARGTMADFLDIDAGGNGRVNLGKAEKAGKLHLVKTFADGPKTGVRIELYDAQAALAHLAKVHGAFIERLQVDVRRDVTELSDEELANIIRSRSGAAGEA